MTARLFRAHGEFCATHPWELIMATLTLITCMLTLEHQHLVIPPKPPPRNCAGCLYETEYNAADVIVMTLIRCLAVLYSYYQFRILRKMGLKYILGIAGLFTVCSSFIFTSALVNFLQFEMPDLKDTLFFFLLLIDLSKTGKLAQFALSGSNEEVKANIARGIALLGPELTLDTVVETLVIGVGTMSGVHRLEVLSYIACLSVIVNYVIFMTFYPACLSLILELSRITTSCDRKSVKKYLMSASLIEEDQKSNPIVHRIKLIMSLGLVIVHIHSRWSFEESSNVGNKPFDIKEVSSNYTDDATLRNYIIRWVTLSTDHIVVLMLFLALVAKFLLFDNKEELSEELNLQVMPKGVKCDSNKNASFVLSKTKSIFQDNDVLDKEKEYENKSIQTTVTFDTLNSGDLLDTPVKPPRDLAECLKIYESQMVATQLTDEEVILLVKHKHIPIHQLEKAVENPERAVVIRRKLVGSLCNVSGAVVNLPYKDYDYSKVMGACCENVIGYVPVPVGIVGPLHLDGSFVYVPMATTEGCLVASTNRGSRALLKSGITSRVVADGMTRGPVVRFPSVDEASEALAWIETPENFIKIQDSFNSTSRFAKLKKVQVRMAARYLFIRFVASTGDAMGMNMLSKGTDLSLKMIRNHFPNMQILSLSGNFCTDKKPAAVNWIEGRGKYVVCEAIVPFDTVTSILKTNVHALVDVNISKNLVGSAIAGSIGGFNAHAANLVTAIYIATGQDPAQNIVSSNCMTIMEPWGDHGEDLYISCTMPSIEIGTIGGGTVLPAQSSCLEILGVKGPNSVRPGENANRLARIVCGAVLAGELSLMAALTEGHLVESHLKYNRSTAGLSTQADVEKRALDNKKCDTV